MDDYKETKGEKLYNIIITPIAWVISYTITGILLALEFCIKIVFLPLSFSLFNRFMSYDEIENYPTMSKSSTNYDEKQKLLFKISLSILVIFILGLLFFPPIQENRGDWLYTVCDDGWVSESRGSGTCSWHGGIDYYVYEELPDTYLIWPYITLIGSYLVVSAFQSHYRWKSFKEANIKRKTYMYYQIMLLKNYFRSAFFGDKNTA